MSTRTCRVIMSLIHTPTRPSMPIVKFGSRQLPTTRSRTEEGEMSIRDPDSAARSNLSGVVYRRSLVSLDGNDQNLKRGSIPPVHPVHPDHSETHSPVQSEYASGDRGIRLDYRRERLPPPRSPTRPPAGLQSRSFSSVLSFHTHPHGRTQVQNNSTSGSNVGRSIGVERSHGQSSSNVLSSHVHSRPTCSPQPHTSKVADTNRDTDGDLIRSPSNKDVSPTSPDMEDQILIRRLHTLLDEVQKVLRSYSSTLNPSARRVQVLYTFYDRVYNLIHPPSPDPYSSRSRSRAGVQSSSISVGIDQGKEGEGEGEGRRGRLTAGHVEQLESEWWESEVVAAWYGPISPTPNRLRPHPHLSTPLMVTAGPGPGLSRQVTGPEPTTSRRVDGTYTPGVVGDRKGREEAIKRDASFVGLYDE